MVDEEVGVMYDQMIAYATAKRDYYLDASMGDGEFSDHVDQDLTSLISTIQFQIKRGASVGEAASLRAYRDIRSTSAEYEIRSMSRKDYWDDAAEEEADNVNKLTNNKVVTNLRMNGKDTGA